MLPNETNHAGVIREQFSRLILTIAALESGVIAAISNATATSLSCGRRSSITSVTFDVRTVPPTPGQPIGQTLNTFG